MDGAERAAVEQMSPGEQVAYWRDRYLDAESALRYIGVQVRVALDDVAQSTGASALSRNVR